MQISYGPPGHRGVTHAMAIGADEIDGVGETDKLLSALMLGSAGAAVAGRVVGSKTVSLLGVGGVIVLLIAKRALKKPQVVAATGYY